MARAALRTDRSLADITILAVTKTMPFSSLEEAWKCGLRHVGESRIQEAALKKSSFQTSLSGYDINWHLVGHLQTNKAKKAVEIFDFIQSLDSLRLAEILNREAAVQGKVIPCLVEIKVSDEQTKFGLAPEHLDDFLSQTSLFPFLQIEGLMTMAPYFEESHLARPYFRRAKDLFDRFFARFKGNRPILSMGMSHDYEVAVEEGANMIRIGTALFGQRPQADLL
ncbi:MAG: YggS family pyridoxal phosphate-dependent enzyme [Elusimicrobia bacterium]|nr:YggS family pyridoxal phosphate-dependent enzyme [Elusimicrobiota bacterium]